jgi:hypothetical protein
LRQMVDVDPTRLSLISPLVEGVAAIGALTGEKGHSRRQRSVTIAVEIGSWEIACASIVDSAGLGAGEPGPHGQSHSKEGE